MAQQDFMLVVRASTNSISPAAAMRLSAGRLSVPADDITLHVQRVCSLAPLHRTDPDFVKEFKLWSSYLDDAAGERLQEAQEQLRRAASALTLGLAAARGSAPRDKAISAMEQARIDCRSIFADAGGDGEGADA